MCKKNFFIALSILLLVGCAGKNQHERKIVYDEAVLKNLVLHSLDKDTKRTLSTLDSLFEVFEQDSVSMKQSVLYLERPFGDPNSAYRNDTLYSELLEIKVASRWFAESERKAATTRIHLLKQNRVGTLANNFSFTTPQRIRKELYDLSSDLLLLLFYNPECPACSEMTDAIAASASITKKTETGELKILAVYIDRDEKIWADHLPALPKEWIHGRDDNEYLYKNGVYDLRAIPTLYLLDRDKKVLIKDCQDIAAIESQLINNEKPTEN